MTARIDLDALAERPGYYRDDGLPEPRRVVTDAEFSALITAVRAAQAVYDHFYQGIEPEQRNHVGPWADLATALAPFQEDTE